MVNKWTGHCSNVGHTVATNLLLTQYITKTQIENATLENFGNLYKNICNLAHSVNIFLLALNTKPSL